MGGAFSSRSNVRRKKNSYQGKRPSATTTSYVRPSVRWKVDNKLKELGRYLPLYKAAIEGEWEVARKFIVEDPEALTARISISSESTLHIAVGIGKERISFVERLIRKMSPEDLALTDQSGETALSVAAIVGNCEAAELLVDKNPDLPYIQSSSGLPIHRAAQYGHRDMVTFLLECTRKEVDPNVFTGESGAKLLRSVLVAEFYDIALDLIGSYPELATIEVQGHGSPLSVLAEKPNAFPSGFQLKIWPQILNPVWYWKYTKDRKVMHRQVLELVECLCLHIMELEDDKTFSMFQQPLHSAARLGVHEIVEEIVKIFPPAIWLSNEENHNVFQLAVTYRREKVFNLIYQMSNYRHLVTKHIDSQGNNILHLAARLPPSDRLNLVSGAALQMQRELQWFQEVERFVQPAYKVDKNLQGKTPSNVFSEAHKQLIKDGERWMKDTATSCSVVAALIATVVFAAAITVPGGNDQSSGIPLFINPAQKQQIAFAIFGVTDTISLFSSVASILMFLSILTSRYAEGDFLHALPKRLIIGLTMLFVSMTTMVIAFSVTVYMVFGQKHSWRLVLVGGLASLPVGLFVFLQFPLLREIFMATYGCSIFRRQGVRMLH